MAMDEIYTGCIKKFQIPLRTPQRTQPVLTPKGCMYMRARTCEHYGILFLLQCTHFAWPSCIQLVFTYIHLWCMHCAWINSTAVHLYLSPGSAHS